MVLILGENQKFGSHPQVCEFIRGVQNLMPALPRYTKLWDPNIIFTYLRSVSPAQKLSLKQLSLKTLMLILLVSGQRLSTIACLHLDRLTITGSKYVFQTQGCNKQSRPGYKDPDVLLRAYPVDRRLCVFKYITEYLKRTSELRADCRSLFITYIKNHICHLQRTL